MNIETEIPTIVGAPSVQERPVIGEPIEDKEKIVEISDANLQQYLEAVKNVETTHGKALHDVTQRVIVLETEIEHLLEKVDSVQEAEKTDEADINKLVAKMQEIEMDMEKIGQAMDRLLDDKKEQETHINVRAFNNKIKLIKVIVRR